MVIDTLIILITKFFLKIKTKKINIFLSALFGTLMSLISPLFSNILNILLKILTSIIMCMIAFWPKNFKSFLLQLSLFYFSTFLMIGACLALAEMFGIKYLSFDGASYEYNFPIGFTLLICAFTYFLAKNILTSIFSKHKFDKYLFDVSLCTDQNKVSAVAFLDTGNNLEVKGKPISIINFGTFSKLYPTISVTDILLKKTLPLKNFDRFEVKGLGKAQKIIIFEIDSLEIDKKIYKNAVLGLSLEKFEKTTQSDMIISNKILEDIK